MLKAWLSEHASLDLLTQPLQTAVEQALHGRWTHLQLTSQLAVTGSFQHHLADHVALAGLQQRQHGLKGRLGFHVARF
jgi:hypothetical protein